MVRPIGSKFVRRDGTVVNLNMGGVDISEHVASADFWSAVNPALGVTPRRIEFPPQPEELHPDLVPYWDDGPDVVFPCVRHPLVYSVPHTPQMNAIVNRQYESKLELVEQARVRRDLSSFVFLHERPYRVAALREVADGEAHRWGLSEWSPDNDSLWWTAVREAWIDSENIHQNLPDWEHLFLANNCFRRNTRSLVMTSADSAVLDFRVTQALTGEVHLLKIYRGVSSPTETMGWSWTTNRDKAKWFANRFSTNNLGGWVWAGEVDPRAIVAIFGDRNEAEVVVDPEAVVIMGSRH
jgi:hypothetical protein